MNVRMPPQTPRDPRGAPKPPAGVAGRRAAARLSSRPGAPAPLARDVRLAAGAVTGLLPDGIPYDLALIWNGALAGSATVLPSGAFRLPTPADAVDGRFDVIEVATGRSILPAPLEIDIRDRITWLGWALRDRTIEGRFQVDAEPGGAPPPRQLLLQAWHDDTLFVQAVATAGEDGVHRFRGPVRLLVRLDHVITLRPRVAGRELDQPLALTAADLGATGHLDEVRVTGLRGWAIDPRDRSDRLAIECRIDGERFATVVADTMREDLLAHSLSDGRSGFEVPLPDGLDRTRPWRLQALLAGTETELIGSPMILPALPPVVGVFDAIEGPFAGGWAVNMRDPSAPLALEAVCGGEVIGRGVANLYRGDVEAAGMPTAWCGFRFLLDRPLVSLFDRDIIIRTAGSANTIGGSPRQVSRNSNIVRHLTRAAALPGPTLHRLARRMTRQTAATTVTVVMPVYNTKAAWLTEALNSVLGQWSANWELVCVDDASTAPHVAELLHAASRHDARIRVLRLPANAGIAAATNAGIRAARGQFVAFLDHDDVLEPDAVHKLAIAAQRSGADLIYSDEAVTTEDVDSIVEVRARPAFSHDYYLSHPYFVHLVCVRTALARQLGGWDETLPISSDVDFVLRAVEAAGAVAHVPSVLYRWRTHAGSTGHAKLDQVTAAMTGILSRHLQRLGREATVRPGFRYNEYRIDWPDDGGEVLIVIPTRNRVDLLRTCIDSVEATSPGERYRIVVIDHESTDPSTLDYLRAISGRHAVMPYSGAFNYARMNNLAVATHGGDAAYILFLNNDVEAREPAWIGRLRSLAGRPEVGAVGPLLLYGDDRVQHAGVLMGFGGAADHAMKFHAAYLGDGRHPGYNCNLTSVRDYSAVTAACVMIRGEVFRQVGGFDERFVIGFNDTDLCLRIVEAGFKVLYDGFTVLYHHESATRTESKSVYHPEDDARLRERWGRYLTGGGDPFYNPMLTPRGTDHTLRQDAGCKGRMGVRVMAGLAGSERLAAPGPRKPREGRKRTRSRSLTEVS